MSKNIIISYIMKTRSSSSSLLLLLMLFEIHSRIHTQHKASIQF